MNEQAVRRIALQLIIAWAAVPVVSGCAEARQTTPNVLLYVIDTLRADRVGAYGSAAKPSATPNLDAFARDSILFERALAPSPHTATSHATLFTSTQPRTHGVWNRIPQPDGEVLLPRLSPNAVTLAEILGDNGYQTAGIADGGWVTKWRGLSQGFETFDSEYRGVVDRTQRALDWLERRDESRPFFLFLHTYEVHAPLVPPLGYEDRFAADYQGPLRGALAEARKLIEFGEVENPFLDIGQRTFGPILNRRDPDDIAFQMSLYDAELSLVDEQFAISLRYLESHGLLEQTILIVTSDHGEEFNEHGIIGHEQVYEPLLRIPLIARAPTGPRGVRRKDFVRLLDIMPSVLDYLEIEPPPQAQGRTIGLTRSSDSHAEEALIFEARPDNAGIAQAGVRRGPFKAIFHERPEKPAEVYHVERDPLERNDIAQTIEANAYLSEARQLLQDSRDAARRHRKAHDLQPLLFTEAGIPPTERDALRALGYLQE